MCIKYNHHTNTYTSGQARNKRQTETKAWEDARDTVGTRHEERGGGHTLRLLLLLQVRLLLLLLLLFLHGALLHSNLHLRLGAHPDGPALQRPLGPRPQGQRGPPTAPMVGERDREPVSGVACAPPFGLA